MIQIIKKHPVLVGSLLLLSTYTYQGPIPLSQINIATINVGVTPDGLALTPDNKLAYVANNNNYVLPDADTVSVLDLENNLVLSTISDASFNQPYTVTMNAQGTKAYVTNSNSTTVTIINVPNNSIAGIIDGFDGPSGFVITPDGTTAYVNNYGGPDGVGSGNGKTIRVVDLRTNSIVGAAITVDQAPAALALSPDGAFLYSINYVDGNPGTGTMNVIRTSTNTVIATVTGFSGPFDIVITSDGKFAYVTNFGSNNFYPFGTTVSVVDLTKNKIIKNIEVGIQPSGIALSPDDRYAYVTNYDTLYTDTNFSALAPGQGTVNIIDTKTNRVLEPTIPVGQSPANIAVSSDGAFAYVSNFTSNVVNVLNILERGWF